MAKLDVYLRSIEKFGATGAVLVSGQAVTLRFPTGDRHATQVTPHDQLVAIVREVAPPNALDQIDKSRPARFELDSAGKRYAIAVAPKAGAWQVAIDGVAPNANMVAGEIGGSGPSPAPTPPPAAPPPRTPRAPTSGGPFAGIAHTPPPVIGRGTASAPATGGPGADVALERGQYDGDSVPTSLPAGPGGLLEQLTRAARAAGASDLYLGTGTAPVHRIAGELVATGTGVLDGDVLSRELGTVAPAEARAAWAQAGTAMFTYGDGSGRIRVTLARDHRGPSAALRLLPDEPPTLAQLRLGGVEPWLGARGLVVVAGPSGSGKTVTLGALVRALGERRRRVVTIEEPIELVHASAWISQRAIGEHVAAVSTAVGGAMNEGADAIVIGRVASEATAAGVVEAVAGGHLVLTTVVAPVAGVALDRMIAHLPADQRELAHGLLFSALLGTIQPVVGKGGDRAFEITARQA